MVTVFSISTDTNSCRFGEIPVDSGMLYFAVAENVCVICFSGR
jgi:hypothetical protein